MLNEAVVNAPSPSEIKGLLTAKLGTPFIVSKVKAVPPAFTVKTWLEVPAPIFKEVTSFGK